MPDWQGELESLLATLNVSLEGVSPDASDGRMLLEGPLGFPGDEEPRGAAEALVDDEPLVEVAPREGDEVSAVRREIEATVAQVVALVRAGRLEPALRDDVIFVLDALTRPRPGGRSRSTRPASPGGPDDSATEWQLASAAAILRFCRIVLRLTNTLGRDDEL